MLPHHVELAVAGKTLRIDTRTNVVINPDFRADAFALPDEPRTEVDEAAAKRGGVSSQYVTRWHALGLPLGDQDQTLVAADAVTGDVDVQYLTGGTHHSLAIKLGEGIVVVDSPLNEARSRAVLDKLDELIAIHFHYFGTYASRSRVFRKKRGLTLHSPGDNDNSKSPAEPELSPKKRTALRKSWAQDRGKNYFPFLDGRNV